MSEALDLPTPSADALARILVRAVLDGKSPAKLGKVCHRLRDLADEMEEAALASANVYPITGGGRPYGQREADLDLRAAAHALRAAIPAELPRAVLAANRALLAL